MKYLIDNSYLSLDVLHTIQEDRKLLELSRMFPHWFQRRILEIKQVFNVNISMKDYMGKKVHLINKEGDKLVIGHCDFMDSLLNADNRYSDYEVDIDWYLNNGYMTLKDMRKSKECCGYDEYWRCNGK